MTAAPEPHPTEPPSDPWALPSTSHPATAPITPYLSLPQQPAPPQSVTPPGDPFTERPPAGQQYAGPTSGALANLAQHGPVIVQIGEIAVTSTLVRTPAGDLPLAGSTWQVADYWQNEQKVPTWAVIAAVLGFCVLTVFSLLFLLVKETIYRGTAQITVTNGNRQYVARIPITDQAQLAHLHQQVNYVRSLAAL